MVRLALVVLVATAAAAAEPPPVPDPFGLGERLALIDHLQEDYGIAVPPGSDLDALRRRYHQAWAERQHADEDSLERDERNRLRDHLAREYGVIAGDEASLADLRALLAQQAPVERSYRLSQVDGAHGSLPSDRPTPGDAPTTDGPTLRTTETAAAPPTLAPWKAKDLPPFAEGIRRVLVWEGGGQGVICVQVGDPGAVDFDGGCAYFAQQVRQAGPTVTKRAVYLIGHGGGRTVAGAELDDLLRTQRTYLETLGGEAEAGRIDLLVVASCSKGGAQQMGDVADGLGYVPLRRVATSRRTYANLPTVIAATAGVLAHNGTAPFRAAYRFREGDLEAASTGEVGPAKTGDLQVFRVGITPEGRLEVVPQG